MRRAVVLAAFAILLWGCKGTPNIVFEPLDSPGKQLTLESLRGKVVLIDFWATWCGPCLQSMPFIQELHEKYGPKGLEIVAISNERREVVKKFEVNSPYSYPVYIDPDGSALDAFRVEGIPRTILLDQEGKILVDGHPMGEKERIEEKLASLLGG